MLTSPTNLSHKKTPEPQLPTTNPTLWKTLAKAITGQPTCFDAFDDNEILNHAGLHGVDILLHSKLQTGTITGISEALKKDLKSAAYPHAAHDMVLNNATQKLLDLLTKNQIPALLLKGTPIAHLYYPGTHLRPRCDTDIYINESDLDKTATLLTRNKYELNGLGKRKHSSKQFAAAIATFKNSFVQFDMHWKLSNRVMFQSTLPFEECLKTSQPVAALGPNARALSITDLMLHACIHRIAHGRNTESDRLIWLYDIHLIAEAMSDTELDEFLLKAKQKNIAILCADALETCRDIFTTSLPGHYISRLKENSEGEPSARLIDASKLRWAWEDLQSLDSISKKIAFARELIFK